MVLTLTDVKHFEWHPPKHCTCPWNPHNMNFFCMMLNNNSCSSGKGFLVNLPLKWRDSTEKNYFRLNCVILETIRFELGRPFWNFKYGGKRIEVKFNFTQLDLLTSPSENAWQWKAAGLSFLFNVFIWKEHACN